MPDGGPIKARVAVLVSGTGTNMAALLYASRSADCPYEIVLVSGDNPAAPGLALAEAEGLPVHRIERRGKIDGAALWSQLSPALDAARADHVVLAGFLRLVPPEVVACWEGRMLNIHPSLLPRHKGLHIHERVLAAAEAETGCTVHVVTAELDDGPILGQTQVAVLPGDTPDTLGARVLIAEHQLLPRCLAEYVTRPFRADWLLDQVRRRALALPEAEERDSHGSPGWRTGGKSGKFFAYFADQHHGSDHVAVLVKVGSPDELNALVELQPDAYFRPQYYGAAGWVGMILNRPGLDWASVEERLQTSWRAVAPTRLTRLLSAADDF